MSDYDTPAAFGMDELLELAVEEGASDIHITVNSPPMFRIHGNLTPLDLPLLTPEDTDRLMRSITSPENQQAVRERDRVRRCAERELARIERAGDFRG